MEPRAIPFDRCVLPIVAEPISMRRRLDFADWLAKNGHAARADWFRRVCTYCEQRRPLADGYSGGLDLDSSVPYEKMLKERCEQCRPTYWRELEGVLAKPGIVQQLYFGRVIISIGAYPSNYYPVLGETPWLLPAFHEGWLESLYCWLLHAEQVRALLEWPEACRALPLHVNTLRCQPEGFDNRLMQEILSLAGLQGILLAPEEIACPCMKRFGELARNLRYLGLLSLRKTGPSYRILEQLPQLSELRQLTIGQNLPTDEQIEPLAAIPKLQCLHLCGVDVTDRGLLAVQAIRTLRTLLVSSRRVTRAGVYALREARPDLRVVLIDDALERLGPA